MIVLKIILVIINMKLHQLFESPDMIDTPEFKAWFRNSKVVDKNGKPLRVYHGTGQGWRGPTPIIDTFNTTGSEYQRVAGAYFTKNQSDASKYGKNGVVYPVYLSIQNPATRVDLEKIKIGTDGISAREILQKMGFDGVIDEFMDEIVVFNPNQIKSAVGNSGKYDPTSDDISESKI